MTGKWIAPPAAPENCHYWAWKTFQAGRVPDSVELRVACESHYVLFINGQCVGRGPARGTRSLIFYDAYEVARFLRPGENEVRVLASNMGAREAAAPAASPCLWLEIDGFAATDGDWRMCLCTKEWPADVPMLSFQNGYCEWRDLRYVGKEPDVAPVVLPPDAPVAYKKLCPSDIPLPEEQRWYPSDVPAAAFVPPADLSEDIAHLSTVEPHSPLPPGLRPRLYSLTLAGDQRVAIDPPPGNGGLTVVFDFGREISGRIEIEATATAGTVADIAYEEELFEGERLRADQSLTGPNYHFADRFILRNGRQCFGNILKDRGYRLIQLTIRQFTGPLVIHAVQAVDSRYPFAARATFHCGDYQLNRIWDMARETMSACITDIFTDCPWRERLFFSNDFIVENRIALQLFGDPRLHRRAIRMLCSEMDERGLVTCCCPDDLHALQAAGNDGLAFTEFILSSSLTFPLSILDCWIYTGDREIVLESYPYLERLMATFAGWLGDDGILVPPASCWNFFDWSYELNGKDFTGKATSLLNYLYLLACQAMNRLAASIGRPAPYEEAALARLADNTFHAFWLPDRQRLADGRDSRADDAMMNLLGVPLVTGDIDETSRLPHALAILADPNPDRQSLFRAGLLDESLLSTELYYWYFMLAAMRRLGLSEDIWRNVRRYWGAVADAGSPTLWENGVHQPGKAGFAGSASLCHGFSSSPAGLLQTEILGVEPLGPGFAEFRFAPTAYDVGFAAGLVPTPHGAIRVSWRCDANQVTAELTVPEGCMACTPAGRFTTGVHRLSWKR